MKFAKWCMFIAAVVNLGIAIGCLFLTNVDASRYSTIMAFLCLILANQFNQNEK